MGAIYWARPKAVYFTNTRQLTAAIGFDDELICTVLEKDLINRSIPIHCIISEEATMVFKEWEEKRNRLLS